MHTPTLILASQSKQRKLLFETLGVPFTVLPAEIDEKAVVHEDPRVRVQMVAQAKARAIATRWKETNPGVPAIIVAADTFSYSNGVLFEKPETPGEAVAMLTALVGAQPITLTGVCVLDTRSGTETLHVSETSMVFRDLSKEEIERYVRDNPVTTWAGGFSPAYHDGMALFARVEGSLTNFTHGLPMEAIVPTLRALGILKEAQT